MTDTLSLELARYTTRPDDEAAFLASHARAMTAMRAAHPGLLAVTVVRLERTPDATRWVDVALWASPEAARVAGATCMEVPEFAACAPYIQAMEGMEHGAVVARH